MADTGTSASPTASTAPTNASSPLFKEFRCDYPGCSKSFSRAEHLHRHALNHDDTRANKTCVRCSAVFKRGDLLDRHMLRHKEKDEEAGGEGLGKLQTRKRLWRDATGTVVAKRRPEHEKKRSNSSSSPKKGHMRIAVDPQLSNINPELRPGPISPLRSLQAQHHSEQDVMDHEQMSHGMSPSDEVWPVPSGIDEASMTTQAPPVESFDFLCNASWGTQPSEGNNSDILFNDLFAPDTASSFNMPFTTMNYYNWLFGGESWTTSGYDGMNLIGQTKLPGLGSMLAPPNHSTPSSSSRGLSVSDASGDYSQLGHRYEYPPLAFKDTRATSDYSSGSYTQEAPTPETSAANQILAMSQAAEMNMATSLGYPSEPPPVSRSYRPRSPALPAPSISPYVREQINIQIRPRTFPTIDAVARMGILNFIICARPREPDGHFITPDHPLLSLDVLQKYCDLYFSRFNISYPLLHAPTFDPARVDPLMLISVLLLGATYDNKDSHLFAICVHDSMRAQIFGSSAFNTRPTLWMLQTILLVECFGKSRAGQLQHDMSHLFHGLLINLIRRSDCQSARCQVFDPSEIIDIDRRWRAEVEAEQKRRLALLCFMWDTQHAVLFSQSLCMNAAELKLTLPWNESLWDAQTAEEWVAINSIEQPQPQYLAVLKTYINPRTEVLSRSLNSLSRVLMLHGLMSVAWDLNRRDQTSLGLSISKDEPWQARISRSYDAWKADFDTFTKETLHQLSLLPPPPQTSPPPNNLDPSLTSSSPPPSQERTHFLRFTISTLAIYHSAQILLQVEINDLQIYAGATHIIGRAVTPADRSRSRARIERWAQPPSISAAKAGSHAALILRDGIRKLKDWDAGDAFHYPWCLYLATLTCWAFQTCSKIAEGPDDGVCSDNEEESDWDARAEMNALVSAMTRSSLEDLWKVAGKYRTTDLPRMMAKHLSSIRWAVVQEAMIVLKGLAAKGRVA